MEDSEIIALFFARSEQAIQALADKYGRIFQNLAGNILANRRDAEECINDTYLGVWNRIPPSRPENLAAYVCRITRNLALKRYESNNAKKRKSQYDIAYEELENCLYTAADPAIICEKKELIRLIETFLDSLKQEDRILFIRRYWFADSVLEIAAKTGMTPNNVSVRLARTRDKLKIYLERSGY